MRSVVLSLTVLLSAAAQAEIDINYYEYSKPEIEVIAEDEGSWIPFSAGLVGDCSQSRSTPMSRDSSGPGDWIGDLDEANLVLDKVINLGKKIWDVLEKGRPVVNIKTDVATALPMGSRCWLDLQGWDRPKSTLYGVKYKNAYGIEVVNFQFRLLTLSGGNVDGKGKYIGYATVMPAQVDVAWGYTLNSEVEVQSVFNMGSKEQPVGGLQIALKYSVNTVMKHSQESVVFFVDGKGNRDRLR